MCGYDWDDVGNMFPWPKSRKIDVEGLKRYGTNCGWKLCTMPRMKLIHYLTDLEEENREEGRDAFISLHLHAIGEDNFGQSPSW